MPLSLVSGSVFSFAFSSFEARYSCIEFSSNLISKIYIPSPD